VLQAGARSVCQPRLPPEDTRGGRSVSLRLLKRKGSLRATPRRWLHQCMRQRSTSARGFSSSVFIAYALTTPAVHRIEGRTAVIVCCRLVKSIGFQRITERVNGCRGWLPAPTIRRSMGTRRMYSTLTKTQQLYPAGRGRIACRLTRRSVTELAGHRGARKEVMNSSSLSLRERVRARVKILALENRGCSFVESRGAACSTDRGVPEKSW